MPRRVSTLQLPAEILELIVSCCIPSVPPIIQGPTTTLGRDGLEDITRYSQMCSSSPVYLRFADHTGVTPQTIGAPKPPTLQRSVEATFARSIRIPSYG